MKCMKDEEDKDLVHLGETIFGQDLQYEVEVGSPIRTVFHRFRQNLSDSFQIRTNLMKHENSYHHTSKGMSTTRYPEHESTFS
jgi:hypothetical protein